MRKKIIVSVIAVLIMALAVTPSVLAAPNCQPQTNGIQKVLSQKVSVLLNNKTDLSKSILERLCKYYNIDPNTCAPNETKSAPKTTTKPQQPSTKPASKPVSTPTTNTAKPQPTPVPSEPQGNISDLEQQMVNMVNKDRAAAGLPALKISSALTTNARLHSEDMAKNNFFSHTSPTRGSFSQRVKGSGIKYSAAGENIARYNSVEKAQAGLMNSEGHRANILSKTFTHVGIGIVWDNDKGAYSITQWFAKL